MGPGDQVGTCISAFTSMQCLQVVLSKFCTHGGSIALSARTLAKMFLQPNQPMPKGLGPRFISCSSHDPKVSHAFKMQHGTCFCFATLELAFAELRAFESNSYKFLNHLPHGSEFQIQGATSPGPKVLAARRPRPQEVWKISKSCQWGSEVLL